MSDLSWKAFKLQYFTECFGDVIADYENYHDDRRWYVNTYNMIIESINSLPEEPPVYVAVAMNDKLDEDITTMKRIRAHFKGR